MYYDPPSTHQLIKNVITLVPRWQNFLDPRMIALRNSVTKAIVPKNGCYEVRLECIECSGYGMGHAWVTEDGFNTASNEK